MENEMCVLLYTLFPILPCVQIGPDFAGVLGRCEEDKLHPSLFFFERKQDQDHATAYGS